MYIVLFNDVCTVYIIFFNDVCTVYIVLFNYVCTVYFVLFNDISTVYIVLLTMSVQCTLYFLMMSVQCTLYFFNLSEIQLSKTKLKILIRKRLLYIRYSFLNLNNLLQREQSRKYITFLPLIMINFLLGGMS